MAVIESPNDITFGGRRLGDMDRAELVLIVARLLDRPPLTIGSPPPVERNQIIPGAMPAIDHVLEREADASQFEHVGTLPPMPAYTPPQDRRVQGALKEAAARRQAEKPLPPTKLFTDPRLKPGYKPRRK